MKTILQAFPQWRTEILHLLCIDPNFREMCEDYTTVVEHLTAWLLTQDVAQTQIVEWRALLHELDAEIREAVCEYKTQDAA